MGIIYGVTSDLLLTDIGIEEKYTINKDLLRN